MAQPDDVDQLAERLVETVRFFAENGHCPATGGNFSLRSGDRVLITASGVDKRSLTRAQLLGLTLDGQLCAPGKPSAETELHLALYRADADIGAVLHIHSVAATVLSRLIDGDTLPLHGYEMQKAISGIDSHQQTLLLPLVDNSQQMACIAEQIERQWSTAQRAHAVLVRGHGLYAWGHDLAAARRHLEGWEFLLQCELNRRLLERNP
ncbi:MAG TPA: methylthioribulose 1-phosphate dehydratase [Pseudomonadales bacterium]|nr:methylthioribulose 1-phosphate dehydratase [Pseudomonadales bacterium]HMU90707.1 methylthioribulose 1-phosphate dehydratase [Pseudomonadales bacterium]HMY97757.1 methylthioribulose 1-phosphate dehydratase [Pseudomonadales bacterium]HMZ71401.1 methylthioribulose 1-phosphate dehydratase [Pseudomonadales bacterium]HMZ92389.1 methylthioribulose 1-phosphate dehydratase [Pseudomonadales bacterium]